MRVGVMLGLRFSSGLNPGFVKTLRTVRVGRGEVSVRGRGW